MLRLWDLASLLNIASSTGIIWFKGRRIFSSCSGIRPESGLSDALLSSQPDLVYLCVFRLKFLFSLITYETSSIEQSLFSWPERRVPLVYLLALLSITPTGKRRNKMKTKKKKRLVSVPLSWESCLFQDSISGTSLMLGPASCRSTQLSNPVIAETDIQVGV